MDKQGAARGVAVDSATLLYGVFGDPVRHSKSPIMLGRAFAETGKNAAYVAFHVKPEALGDAVRGVRALGICGVNVTIPHKVEVMKTTSTRRRAPSGRSIRSSTETGA